MMGSRGKLTGPQWDAFSRLSRRLLHWRPGEIRALKRAFARKRRRTEKQSLDRSKTD